MPRITAAAAVLAMGVSLFAADAQKLLESLKSRYKSERDNAVAQIIKLDDNARAAIVPDLVKLVEAGDWQPMRCAALALQGIGPAAAPAAAKLKPALIAAIRQPRPAAVELLQATIAKVSPGAQKGMVAEVAALLKDKDDGVKKHACVALERIGPDAGAAAPALLEAAKSKVPTVAAAAAEALAAVGPPADAAAPLAAMVESDNTAVALAALKALGAMGAGAAGAVPQVAKLANASRNELVASEAVRALGRLGPKGTDAVIGTLGSRVRGAGEAAMGVLVGMGDKAVPLLTAALSGPRKLEAAEALLRLGKGGEKQALVTLRAACDSKNSQESRAAIETLGRWGSRLEDKALRNDAAAAVGQVLAGQNDSAKEAAARALGSFGPESPAAVPALEKAVKDSNQRVAKAAKASLDRIKSQ